MESSTGRRDHAIGWIGDRDGGLLWPVAFIWAFTTPSEVKSAKNEVQPHASNPTE